MQERGISLWLIDTGSPRGKKAAFGRGVAAGGKLLAGESPQQTKRNRFLGWKSQRLVEDCAGRLIDELLYVH
jgi:hypothetical protein